jgi:hypothetical protein
MADENAEADCAVGNDGMKLWSRKRLKSLHSQAMMMMMMHRDRKNKLAKKLTGRDGYNVTLDSPHIKLTYVGTRTCNCNFHAFHTTSQTPITLHSHRRHNFKSNGVKHFLGEVFSVPRYNVSEEPAASYSSLLKMGSAGSSETFVTAYKTTRSHIPEDTNLHIDGLKNITRNIYWTMQIVKTVLFCRFFPSDQSLLRVLLCQQTYKWEKRCS